MTITLPFILKWNYEKMCIKKAAHYGSLCKAAAAAATPNVN